MLHGVSHIRSLNNVLNDNSGFPVEGFFLGFLDEGGDLIGIEALLPSSLTESREFLVENICETQLRFGKEVCSIQHIWDAYLLPSRN